MDVDGVFLQEAERSMDRLNEIFEAIVYADKHIRVTVALKVATAAC